jgi:hypothetical protein
MGGEGSGRRPDPIKQLIGLNQPANTDVAGSFYLPNVSGVNMKNMAIKDFLIYNKNNITSNLSNIYCINSSTSIDIGGDIYSLNTPKFMPDSTITLNGVLLATNNNTLFNGNFFIFSSHDGTGDDSALILMYHNSTNYSYKIGNILINPDGNIYIGCSDTNGEVHIQDTAGSTYHNLDAKNYYASGTPPATDGTYLNPTSITIKGGIITAIS